MPGELIKVTLEYRPCTCVSSEDMSRVHMQVSSLQDRIRKLDDSIRSLREVQKSTGVDMSDKVDAVLLERGQMEDRMSEYINGRRICRVENFDSRKAAAFRMREHVNLGTSPIQIHHREMHVKAVTIEGIRYEEA